ncbi:unnamed protein product [Caenorhabditis auriculariae]|uniref:phosphoribosylformylglycinamidine synthase n=1 Tax=Caenorhabditis auriculariae TaxID=2777116 RepID=A0A8S1GR40_9PELO|nr:unnamed protein product [Caenorhabditis auriculariae]
MLRAFEKIGIKNVERIERSVVWMTSRTNREVNIKVFMEHAGDRMTECIYSEGENPFKPVAKREDYTEVPLIEKKKRLVEYNEKCGLGLDPEDITFYYDYYKDEAKRNPTDVELYDLANSDSEHSRHWFFNANLFVDGAPRTDTLMETVKKTLKAPNNSVLAFCDNSSVIRGYNGISRLRPKDPTTASELQFLFAHDKPGSAIHLLYTAETHNFPTAVCPFQGAATGTGGRIRDVHATGRGAHEIAGVAGYSVGNLFIPRMLTPWEVRMSQPSPKGICQPLKILIEASNGASDYGNKFGEPIICGFVRSLGMEVGRDWYEYLKPIMFSGGIGTIEDRYVSKIKPSDGLPIVKIGGPAYRIGVGGGAASSLKVQGAREDDLEYSAVQRADAGMGNKLHRLVRACAETEEDNPILSIHDQGAGGNANVLKELVLPMGATINCSSFNLGDESLSVKELWTAEYQESDACLVDPRSIEKLKKIGLREGCPVEVVGRVDCKDEEIHNEIVVQDFDDSRAANPNRRPPVQFEASFLQPRTKAFHVGVQLRSLNNILVDDHIDFVDVLDKILHLPSVASKRYLTCKVDRSVTGLVAQQQCVGPLHTPLANVAVVALSHFTKRGGAVAVGEQPFKMLVNVSAGTRMTVAESLLNLAWVRISSLKDVKMSANWMWPAKCDGEGARLVKAVEHLCSFVETLGCAIDGGKDSLSMATKVGEDVIKSPPTLVLSSYATVPDITKLVTPRLKATGSNLNGTRIIYVRLSDDERIGGTALAQVLNRTGNKSPDIDDINLFRLLFETIQDLVERSVIFSGHDVSDGGVLVALLEMAFAANCGLNIEFNLDKENPDIRDYLQTLFSEECGVLIEVDDWKAKDINKKLNDLGFISKVVAVPLNLFGKDAFVKVVVNGERLLYDSTRNLRESWETLGHRIGVYQTTIGCLAQEKALRAKIDQVEYNLDFDWNHNISFLQDSDFFTQAPKVAIIREEGSNGDRELAAAFTYAGFQTWDVTMNDLVNGHSLEGYNGVAFVGGFSFSDVGGSARAWAMSILNGDLKKKFDDFRARENSFSLGICNGCQLMAYLGWIGENPIEDLNFFFNDNLCGRFESSFCSVRVEESEAMMLKGMKDAVLGIWVANGEGRFTTKNPDVLGNFAKNRQVGLRYVDHHGQKTPFGETLPYPQNPSGSEDDIAAICSSDGRHLAMMPHPERSFLTWQWPEYPNKHLARNNDLTPWIKMFRNAYDWSLKNPINQGK